MRSICTLRRNAMVFALAAVLVLAAGCNSASTVAPTSAAPAYTGVLGTTHEDALDVVGQLALGTLKLEETADAVTEAQAADLLPLWEVLAGNTLQTEAERLAAARQVELTMTEAQVAAIAAMALTQADEEAWTTDLGGNAMPGGAARGGTNPAGAAQGLPAAGAESAAGAPAMSEEDLAAMQEQFENMSDEERAAMRDRAGQPGAAGGIGAGGTATSGVMRAVVMLLTERSGQTLTMAEPERPAPATEEGPAIDMEVVETAEVDVTPTAAPTATPTPEPTSEPTSTLEASTSTPSPTATAKASTAAVTEAAATAASTSAVEASVEPATTDATTDSVVSPALVQVEDTDPGPPFSVEISLNQATPNPLLDGTTVYRVSGLLHNDGDEVYAVNTVHITFFDSSGFRGTFNAFPRRRYGEYVWHGAMEADFDCMLLAPGESCPFTAEIAAYDMGSFLVHADAVVAEYREPATVQIQNSELADQGSTVQISGIVFNPNEYAVKNIVVNAALLDANGQITSIGSAYIVQSVAAGASVAFTAQVPSETYVTYQIYAQAEGDFK